MISDDIDTIIVEFISTIKDFLSWRSICKKVYSKQYRVYFTCTKFIKGIIPINLDLSSFNSNDLLEYNISCIGFYIETLICNNFINNEHLKLMPNIKSLNCLNNSLITDNGICNLHNLTYLNCGRADITDEVLINFPNLEILNCGYDSYFSIISNLPKLKILILGFSEINELKNLPKLENLECGNNEITIGIKNLTSLVYLDCNFNNYITSDVINTLVNLKYLYCTYVQNILDIAFINLRNLQMLHCGESTEITNLALTYIPNLISLHCGSNNNITSEGLYNVTKLICLHCGSNNSINDLHMLTNLKYLDCGTNSRIIDETFRTCTTITHLHCYYNKKITNYTLNYLPDLIFLSCNNNFTNSAISKLKKIQHLSYRNSNGISIIPDTIDIECKNCICTFEFYY